ncbi:MAG: putative endonuclease [Oceanospirillaceae bacterium]|jgi:putative endonuclease
MTSIKNEDKAVLKAWFTYMLRCADDTLYAGVTTDCQRRVNEHNGLQKGGARYTQARRPVVMVWFEQNVNRSEACKREAQIKKYPRTKKIALIENADQQALLTIL